MAVLTCLIVSPPNSQVTIYTDSANVISTYLNLDSPTLSPRRLQKINNILLWQAIKHIRTKLNLTLIFKKVRAHSNDHFNDVADALAKTGSDNPSPISIAPTGVLTQFGYFKFNNEYIIDRNIRKTLKKPMNYRIFTHHLSHKLLKTIKDFTYEHIINWEYTQYWFHYNPFTRTTSLSYSKHVSWRCKSSSYQLPTLDIMNRNFESVLNGFDTCFLCNNAPETNNHLWTCTASIDLLIPIFKKHEIILKTLILNNYDRDKVDISTIDMKLPIFTWTSSDPSTIQEAPELHCILLSLVPDSIVNMMRRCQFNKKLVKKLLLKFLFDLHQDIYNILWHKRSVLWKEWKKTWTYETIVHQ